MVRTGLRKVGFASSVPLIWVVWVITRRTMPHLSLLGSRRTARCTASELCPLSCLTFAREFDLVSERTKLYHPP